MDKKEEKINKEELSSSVERLKEVFAAFVSDEKKDGKTGGLVERWIYELSSGDDKTIKAAVSLLRKSKMDYFSKVVHLMIANNLPGTDEVLLQIIDNQNMELEKRAIAYDRLLENGKDTKEPLSEDLKKIIELKRYLNSVPSLTSQDLKQSFLELFNGVEKKWCYIALFLLCEQAEPLKIMEIFKSIEGLNRTVDFNIALLLSRYPLPESISLLEDIYKQTDSKEVQKQVNRTLFLLKQKGIEVDAASFKGEKKPGLKPVQVESQGFISTPTGNGYIQLLFFSFYQAVSGHYLFSAVKDFSKGLVDFNAYKTTKKGVKKYIDFLEQERGTKLFSVSSGHCIFLLEESVEISKNGGGEVPGNYYKWIDIVKKNIQPLSEPEIYEHIKREEIESISIEHVLQEFKENEVIVLNLIEGESLQVVYEKFKEVEESRVIVAQSLREEKIKEAVSEIASSFFDSSLKFKIERKLEELSLILFLSGKRQEAMNLLRLVIEIKEAPKPSDSQFLIYLLGNSLRFYSSAMKKKKEEEAGPSVAMPVAGKD